MQGYYNYSSWNAWNVSLWIDYNYNLYCLSLQWAEEVIKGITTMEEAVDGLLDLTHHYYKDGKTPDGAFFDRESCKEWLLNNHFED